MKTLDLFGPVTKNHLKHVVSKDDRRPAMQGAYLDVDAKKLVATNGYIIITYPVEIDGDCSGIIPIDAFTKDTIEVIVGKETAKVISKTGATSELPLIKEGYPKWQNVWPKCDTEPVELIGFDPKCLAAIYNAIPRDTGKHGSLRPIKCSFHGPTRAMVFETHVDEPEYKIKGLVMPMML